jgi:hypothetical protein
MIRFVLNHENLIERSLPYMFMVVDIKHPETIQECIDDFNAEVQWKNMFTLGDAIERIMKGEKMYVGYHNGKRFGYCWVIQKDYNTYIYNVFSRKLPFPRVYGATDLLYYVIKNHGNKVISADVDEWNDKSIRMFEKLGFKRY